MTVSEPAIAAVKTGRALGLTIPPSLRRRADSRARTRCIPGIALMAVVLLSACPSSGQGQFRITYTPRSREAASVTLDGRVFNDGDRDVLDVWVTAEGLDASGKILATGITFLILIPRHGSATFFAKLPVARGTDIHSFHLAVTSYRDGAAEQAP